MRTVQSLDRGLQVLDILSDADEPVGVTEVAERLKVDKSTAHRLLTTLHERHFVEKDGHARYRISYKPIQIGLRELQKMELREKAQPYLHELVAKTGETAHLAKMIQGRIVFISRCESPNPVAVSTQEGGEAPAHATATGKAIIAFLPQADLVDLLSTLDLVRFTPRTITDLAMLKHHLGQVRQQRYALDDEERFIGVRCVAAPVYDYGGNVIASIGISGPAHRIPVDRLDEFCHAVIKAGNDLSQINGFRATD